MRCTYNTYKRTKRRKESRLFPQGGESRSLLLTRYVPTVKSSRANTVRGGNVAIARQPQNNPQKKSACIEAAWTKYCCTYVRHTSIIFMAKYLILLNLCRYLTLPNRKKTQSQREGKGRHGACSMQHAAAAFWLLLLSLLSSFPSLRLFASVIFGWKPVFFLSRVTTDHPPIHPPTTHHPVGGLYRPPPRCHERTARGAVKHTW